MSLNSLCLCFGNIRIANQNFCVFMLRLIEDVPTWSARGIRDTSNGQKNDDDEFDDADVEKPSRYRKQMLPVPELYEVTLKLLILSNFSLVFCYRSNVILLSLFSLFPSTFSSTTEAQKTWSNRVLDSWDWYHFPKNDMSFILQSPYCTCRSNIP